MRELLARLYDWLRRDRLDAELDEELQFHAERLARDERARDPRTADVAYAAKRRLGNVTRIREEARELWSIPWLDQLHQDVRYALRGLRREPGFATAVILTLGLGIGANAAMFNVIDQLMFRPFAYLRDPAHVHRVYLRLPGTQRLLTNESFPYTRYLDLARWTTSFSQVAAFYPTVVAVGTGAASRERPIAAVSASYFDFFDARPTLGRYFTAAEDTTPSGANVAVLSHAFWTAELGSRDVLGESIQIDNIVCTIIGVAPPGFTGVSEANAPVAFLPITTFGAHQPGGSSVGYWQRYVWDWTEMMVRRKPGVSIEQANADLTQAFVRSRAAARAIHSFMRRTETERPVAVAGALKTAAGPYPGLEARTLVWVMGVAVAVLLIACANVANLFLARALRRQREVAVRLALGVTSRRLAAQSLTESLVLSLTGCVAGLAIAQWGGAALRQLFLPSAGAAGVAADSRTLGVALFAALAAGLLTGLSPLLLARGADIAKTLKAGVREGGGTNQRPKMRAALLVVQVVLSVILLVGAGLFVRSLDRLRDVHLGYDVDPVLLVEWHRRGEAMTMEQRVPLRQRVLEAATAIPGVTHAAWASNIPLQGTSTMSLHVAGVDSVARLGRFTYQAAGADYFATVGTRIVRGRGFTAQDRLGAPTVAVVSASMARVLWPGQDPLGKCMHLYADTVPCTSVVGVAEDAVHDPLADQPLRYYLPMDQFLNEGGSYLVLRLRADPAEMAEPVRRALQAVMPGQQYVTTRPVSDLLDAQRRSWRAGAAMFIAFGVLALVVAAVGLYGVIAYDVGQRMHELGVRIALGAQGRHVVRLVVARGVRLAVAGIAVGSALAIGAARWIEPLLFQQSATDPAVFGVVALVLVAVAVAACSAPAARAVRADPNTVLRAD
jgi:predicted permease